MTKKKNCSRIERYKESYRDIDTFIWELGDSDPLQWKELKYFADALKKALKEKVKKLQ